MTPSPLNAPKWVKSGESANAFYTVRALAMGIRDYGEMEHFRLLFYSNSNSHLEKTQALGICRAACDLEDTQSFCTACLDRVGLTCAKSSRRVCQRRSQMTMERRESACLDHQLCVMFIGGQPLRATQGAATPKTCPQEELNLFFCI